MLIEVNDNFIEDLKRVLSQLSGTPVKTPVINQKNLKNTKRLTRYEIQQFVNKQAKEKYFGPNFPTF